MAFPFLAMKIDLTRQKRRVRETSCFLSYIFLSTVYFNQLYFARVILREGISELDERCCTFIFSKARF